MSCNSEKKGKPKRSRPKPADSGKKDEDELRKEKRKAEAAKKAEEKAAAEAKAAEAAKNGNYLSFLISIQSKSHIEHNLLQNRNHLRRGRT